MAFALSSRGQNDQILIRFSEPTITGESTLTGYTDYVQALSVNFGESTQVTIGAGGVSKGKPDFSNFIFVHNGNKNSPLFNLYVANGKTIATAEIVFLRTINAKPTVIYKITLTNVILTSVNTSGAGDCSSCAFGVENISMFFTKIKWEDPVSNTSAVWDLSSSQGN